MRERERALISLKEQLRAADKAVADAHERLKDLERQLAALAEKDFWTAREVDATHATT